MPRQADFTVKDSGQRQSYKSGMVRDLQDGKARFDLLLAPGVPYEHQLLTRWAMHMTRGAVKYGPQNWTKADSDEELSRFRQSALRHMLQWATGEVEEDHASAVMFNLLAYETTKWKLAQRKPPGRRWWKFRGRAG